MTQILTKKGRGTEYVIYLLTKKKEGNITWKQTI